MSSARTPSYCPAGHGNARQEFSEVSEWHTNNKRHTKPSVYQTRVGLADVEAEGKPPDRFLVAVSRTAEGINGLSTTLKSILAIVAIIIAVVLYALHGGDPSKLFSLSK